MAKNDHHKACANLLMKESGVPRRFQKDVVKLIEAIYDSERMAHCLIILSIRGFRPVSATRSLEYFLQANGTKNSAEAREEWKRQEEDAY